ncbi:hypothetical protein [Herbaspirillum huttiense]|uniref:hypothetical protein n=1 Tax=Herbaspirillum huttiense TaxID=863372 RepID=UPI0031D0FF08
MNHYLLIINLIAAALILARAVCALNEMTAGAEHHLDRLFISLVATGESAILLGPLFGNMLAPELAYVVLNVGIFGIYAMPWFYTAARERLKGRVPWTSR